MAENKKGQTIQWLLNFSQRDLALFYRYAKWYIISNKRTLALLDHPSTIDISEIGRARMEVMKCESAQLALTAAAHPVIGYQILKSGIFSSDTKLSGQVDINRQRRLEKEYVHKLWRIWILKQQLGHVIARLSKKYCFSCATQMP